MSIVTSKEELFEKHYPQLHRRDSLTPICSLLDIEYYRAYCSDSTFDDLSFIAEVDGQPTLAVIAALETFDSGEKEISAFGCPVLCIENSTCRPELLQRAAKIVKRQIEKLIELHPTSPLTYCDFLTGGRLSPLGLFLLDSGAVAAPYFTQVIDLSQSEVLLKEQTRKSYKSLINWGTRNLQTVIVDAQSITDSHIEDFRRLHIDAAGRETRPLRTWQIQHEQVSANEAFLVLGYMDDRLVTATLFQYNQRCCLYGVSASNRDMFDKPMSHSILWTSILHAKRLGCRYIEMGEQLYPSQNESAPTAKELGISKFKRGFGGATNVRLNITLKP